MHFYFCYSFGKRTGGSARRPNECFVLEPSEMIVVSRTLLRTLRQELKKETVECASLTISRKFSHKGMLYLFNFTKEPVTGVLFTHTRARIHLQFNQTGRASVVFFCGRFTAKQLWPAFTRDILRVPPLVRRKRRYHAAKRQCAPDARET